MNTAFKDIEIVSRLGADERTLAYDVLDGLTRPFKEIPPKHFYDTEGSRLFEAITKLPEYYPTRTERAILEANAEQLVALTGMAELVQLGASGVSGSPPRSSSWRSPAWPSWSSSAPACRPRRCCCWTRCTRRGRSIAT